VNPQLTEALTKALNGAVPLLPLLAIWGVWKFFDRQSGKPSAQDEKLKDFVACVEKIWPHVLSSQCSPNILAKDPDSWFVVTKFLAERSANTYINKKLGGTTK